MMDKDDLDYIHDLEDEIDRLKASNRIAQDRLFWLNCLEMAGVDNWEGIDYARELLEEGYE